MDVPDRYSKSPPGIDERISSPGAKSERNGETFENHATRSSSCVAPTLIADEMQAGDARLAGSALFPAATMVATPSARRLSMAGLKGSVSHCASNEPPPRLMFTDATFSP